MRRAWEPSFGQKTAYLNFCPRTLILHVCTTITLYTCTIAII